MFKRKVIFGIITITMISVGLLGCTNQHSKKEVNGTSTSVSSNSEPSKTVQTRQSTEAPSASCFGDQVDVLNNTAVNPIYKKSVISKNDFESNNRITFDKLGIKGDIITEIDAADAKGNGCTFFIKDSNTLILYGGGAYFELNKI